MTDFNMLLRAPAQWLPEGDANLFDTPYGAVEARLGAIGEWRCAWIDTAASPFAAIYAAKAAGATRVTELVPVAARNRLLAPGDVLAPDDLIDRTQLPRYTFFAGKGYGFLSQREPFCPALRAALLAGAARAGRVFARGVYLAEGPQLMPETIWDVDVAGGGVVPANFLARELELCYAPLCLVEPAHGSVEAMLAGGLEHLPRERACACSTAMQQYRERGDIGPDWQTWIAQ
jgi:5'-methylthioadenosine phosphorylase